MKKSIFIGIFSMFLIILVAIKISHNYSLAENSPIMFALVVFWAISFSMYVLYRCGLPIDFTVSILKIGNLGNIYKNYYKGSYGKCSGFAKRILFLEKNQKYVFNSNHTTNGGILEITIKDFNKNIVLKLNEENKIGEIYTDNNRYYLTINFKKFQGVCDLQWNKS